LLTDVIMPGMNGMELALTLKAVRPNLKVLFASGYSDLEPAPNGFVDGAKLLHKPYSPDELSVKVREALAGRP